MRRSIIDEIVKLAEILCKNVGKTETYGSEFGIGWKQAAQKCEHEMRLIIPMLFGKYVHPSETVKNYLDQRKGVINMRNHEKLFEHGNRAQLEKLKEHDNDDDDYSLIDIGDLFTALAVEVEELGEEFCVETDSGFFDQREERILQLKAMRHEAADVANYAHMIILNCDKEISRLIDGTVD